MGERRLIHCAAMTAGGPYVYGLTPFEWDEGHHITINRPVRYVPIDYIPDEDVFDATTTTSHVQAAVQKLFPGVVVGVIALTRYPDQEGSIVYFVHTPMGYDQEQRVLNGIARHLAGMNRVTSVARH